MFDLINRLSFYIRVVIFISLFASCAKPLCPEPQTPVTISVYTGLIAFYPFISFAADSSGNENHGEVYGVVPVSNHFGGYGLAFYFDGDDYLSIPSGKLLNSSYSYCAWVKLDTIPENGKAFQILSIGSQEADQNLAKVNNYYNHSGWYLGSDTSSLPGSFFTRGQLSSENVWYFVAGTRDGEWMKFYIDGQLAGSVPVRSVPSYGTARVAAHIGARSHGSL